MAVELARHLRDPSTLWMVGGIALMYVQAPHRAQEGLRLAEEVLATPRAGVNTVVAGIGLCIAGDPFLAVGERQRAEEIWGELRTMAERAGQVNLWLWTTWTDAILTLMDGRLDEVMDMTGHIVSQGGEAGVSQHANVLAILLDIRTRVYLGGTYLEALERTRLASEVALCLVLAHLGQNDKASEILERLVVKRSETGILQEEPNTRFDTTFLEAAVLTSHRQAIEVLMDRLTGADVRTTGYRYPTVVPRHLGGAAALLGRYDEARRHYQDAIRVCTEMRFRPEHALTRLQLAELLLDHYPAEKKDALDHLDFAIKEFREMKMRPSLERALRRKEILKA